MIRIRLISDGSDSLPIEARDHGLLANRLSETEKPNDSPAPAMGDFDRRVTPSEVHLLIRDATLDDYNGNALDAYAQAITSAVNGLKAHPDGWQEVEP